MKILDRQHDLLKNRTLPTQHHIECDCGTVFAHDHTNGNLCMCPDCKCMETINGAEVARVLEIVQT